MSQTTGGGGGCDFGAREVDPVEGRFGDLVQQLRTTYRTRPAEAVVARHLADLRREQDLHRPPARRPDQLTRIAVVASIIAGALGAGLALWPGDGGNVVVESAEADGASGASADRPSIDTGDGRNGVAGWRTSTARPTASTSTTAGPAGSIEGDGAVAGGPSAAVDRTATASGSGTDHAATSTSTSASGAITPPASTVERTKRSEPGPSISAATSTTPPITKGTSPAPTTAPAPTTTTTATTATTPPSGETCNGRVATIVGGNGSDVLQGTEGPDVIVGLGGDDLIHGLGGDDTICGGNGKDEMFGGPGNDYIHGENGKDLLVGGDGVDQLLGGKGQDKIIEGNL